MWIADSGSFLAPMSATTEYVCGAPTLDATGTRLSPPHTLTLTVSDSYTTPCSASGFFSVDCRQISVCGNGIVEPGEDCDPPTADGTSGATCTARGG